MEHKLTVTSHRGWIEYVYHKAMTNCTVATLWTHSERFQKVENDKIIFELTFMT